MSIVLSTGGVHYVAIDADATVTLAAAVTGKKIRVLGYATSAESAGCTCQLRSVTTETALTGAYVLGNNGVLVAPVHGIGYAETPAGEALELVVSAGAIQGTLVYQYVV